MVEETTSVAGGSAGAILLSLIGEAEAATLVGELAPDEVAAVCAAMELLGQVAELEIETVLGDFIARARQQNAVASAGSRPVRAAIERSLGAGRAHALLQAQGEAEEHPVFAQLAWLPVAEICDLVAGEHPQVAAIILGRIDPAIAARALAALPDDEHADLLHRIATLAPVGRAALDALAVAVAARGCTPDETRVDIGGAARVAAILNRTGRPAADKTLKALARIDKVLAARIDDQRLTFADVVGFPDKDLGSVVRSCEAAVLARALKGVEPKTCDRFLTAMSARAAQTLRDEIEELTGLTRAEVDGAQAAVVAVARRLGEEGAVTMGGGQADYV